MTGPEMAKLYNVKLPRLYRRMDWFEIKRDSRHTGRFTRGSETLRKMRLANLGKVRGEVSEDLKKALSIRNRKTWKNWKPDTEKIYATRGGVKNILRRWYKIDKCQMCGWNKYPQILHLHHKDGNHKNNKVSNCALLCPNCHNEIHYLSHE